ncbi:DNA methyltransferase [Krasilnikovia cinnamomea]|uniref:DNA methyltransferase n=1 Tax=Krasilnikovia cinnamomea TaxID=349313 RepID=UPI0013EEF3D9|nr:DNA methyltransferase [Krasilnikovia cinnamomea]
MTGHPELPALNAHRYRRHGPVQLYLGDATRVLTAMPDDSVDCLVTSPPFWGLRDYGTGRWDRGDPFCGAGTTGLAALQLGRRFEGIDVSSVFLDETLTRHTPHLPGPGRAE